MLILGRFRRVERAAGACPRPRIETRTVSDPTRDQSRAAGACPRPRIETQQTQRKTPTKTRAAGACPRPRIETVIVMLMTFETLVSGRGLSPAED